MNAITPQDQRSTFDEYAPISTSGATYEGDPIFPSIASFKTTSIEVPKSINLI